MRDKPHSMTQIEAIITLFKKGRVLDWAKCFQLTGSSKLATRVSELKKKGYVFKQTKINFITKYGTHGYYYKYKLLEIRKDVKN